MRKAIAEGALALLIIAIVVMGFLGTFVYKYTQRQTCLEKVELCRTSISFLSAYKTTLEKYTLGSGAAALIPTEPKIDCPICVPDSSDDIKGKTKLQTMQEIADHLRWCWYKTGRNIFLFRKTKFCLVCSEFKTDMDITGSEFLDFLSTKKIMTGPGSGHQYAPYLDTSWGAPRILDYDLLIQKNDLAGHIPESEKLRQELGKPATLFPIVANNKYAVIEYNWAWSYTTPFNHVILIPEDKLQNLPCDIYHYQKE